MKREKEEKLILPEDAENKMLQMTVKYSFFQSLKRWMLGTEEVSCCSNYNNS